LVVLDSHDDGVENNKEGDRVVESLVVHEPVEVVLAASRHFSFPSKLFALSDLLNFNPASLVFCHKLVAELFLLLNRVEVVNNHSYEQVDDELASNNHEGDEIDTEHYLVILDWLFVYSS